MSTAHLAFRGLIVHSNGSGRLRNKSTLFLRLGIRGSTNLVLPDVYLISPIARGSPEASWGGPTSNTAKMFDIWSHKFASAKYRPGHILDEIDQLPVTGT